MILGITASSIYKGAEGPVWAPTPNISEFTYTDGDKYDWASTSYHKSIFMKPGGSKMYLLQGTGSVKTATLSTPYDITTLTFDGDSYVLGASSDGLHFSADGVYLFYTNMSGSTSIVTRRVLSTPWDLSTMGAVENLTTAFGTNITTTTVTVDPTGTILTVSGYLSPYSKQFTMSTPFDLSSATEDTGLTLINRATLQDIRWSTTGTRFYNGTYDSSSPYVEYIYDYDTAVDYTKQNGVNNGSLDLSTYIPQSEINTPHGLCFSYDYKNLYVCFQGDGSTPSPIYQFKDSHNWELPENISLTYNP